MSGILEQLGTPVWWFNTVAVPLCLVIAMHFVSWARSMFGLSVRSFVERKLAPLTDVLVFAYTGVWMLLAFVVCATLSDEQMVELWRGIGWRPNTDMPGLLLSFGLRWLFLALPSFALLASCVCVVFGRRHFRWLQNFSVMFVILLVVADATALARYSGLPANAVAAGWPISVAVLAEPAMFVGLPGVLIVLATQLVLSKVQWLPF